MSKKMISIALLSSGLTLSAGLAFAAGPAATTNPERNDVAQEFPVAKSRADVLLELAEFRKNPVSPDGWQYVGGERDWEKIPHRFDLVAGKLVHTDQFDHHVVRPSLSATSQDKTNGRELYRNSL